MSIILRLISDLRRASAVGFGVCAAVTAPLIFISDVSTASSNGSSDQPSLFPSIRAQ